MASELLASLAKLNMKVTSSLYPAICQHTTNKNYDARADGLDFLQVKNGIMISYLIDLTMLLRCRWKEQRSNKDKSKEGDDQKESNTSKEFQECIERLLETKAALEKMRPLEKRMRYQIDKLLALSTLGSGTFAAGGMNEERKESDKLDEGDQLVDRDNDTLGDSDPLSFKPDLQGMLGMFEDDDHMNRTEESDLESYKYETEREQGLNNFKPSITLEKEDNENNLVYQPPRLQSMPFEENERRYAKDERLRKKQRDRMQRSELSEVVRAQYTDAPEEEDTHGGSMLGRQREISKRLAQRDAEIQEFEESHMIRLTTGKKEKKEKKRVMREEMSNLAVIADLRNVVSGVEDAFLDGARTGRTARKGKIQGQSESFVTKSMRKRKVDLLDHELEMKKKRGRRGIKSASNAFQKALFGGSASEKPKKKK